MRVNSSFIIGYGQISQVDKLGVPFGKTALHEAIEIKYFYEGNATLLIDSQTVSVKAGDIVVINPYEFHATVDTGEEKGKYHLFMVPLDMFFDVQELDLQEFFFNERRMFKTHFSGNEEMCSLLHNAAEEMNKKQDFYELRIKGLMMEFFSLLLRFGIANSEFPIFEKSSLTLFSVVDPALQCIKSRYSENLTIDFLSKLCGVSKCYFCRVFKSVTQKSAMEYLRDYRLRVANIMLMDTEKSIAEIAVSCGFESANYFSRCYKRNYGFSPREGREVLNHEI